MSRLAPLYALAEASHLTDLARRVRKGSLVLCYHNVLPAGAAPRGDGSLHLPLEQFQAQLEWLAGRFDIVALDALLHGEAAGRAKPRAAITFDDAYRGVFVHALPELRRRRLAATVFVASAYSDSPRPFWWDLVGAARPQLDRRALRDAHAGRADAILAACGLATDGATLPDEYFPASWSEIRAALDGDLAIGGHSATHPMLSRIPPAALSDEVRLSKATIERALGVSLHQLAYPYGDHSPEVASASAAAGYRAAFTIAGGWILPRVSPMTLPRMNVPSGIASAAFAVSASGINLRSLIA